LFKQSFDQLFPAEPAVSPDGLMKSLIFVDFSEISSNYQDSLRILVGKVDWNLTFV
jgi:hypothetical protein